MTEKRFTLAYEKGNWWAVRDGDITLWKEEVISLLNDFHEENEQLKKENEQLRKESGSFEQISFTDMCNGSKTVLYMKKENGDVE